MSRGEKAERTYQQILAVSEKLFQEQGYERTSIQDILNELKMSKGAVYHHFKSKKEILDAIEEEEVIRQRLLFKKLIKEVQGENALEKIKHVFLKLLASASLKAKERMVAHLDPYAVTSDIKAQPEHAKLLAILIEEGITDGSIKTDYPLELSEVFFILFTTWTNPILFPRSNEETKRRLTYLQLMMKNLGADFIEDELIEKVLAGYEKVGYFE